MAKNDRKKFQLKDTTTSFYDRETDLKVVRDDVVEIDMNARVGKLTLGAIRAGGLIEVNRESKQDKGDDKTK